MNRCREIASVSKSLLLQWALLPLVCAALLGPIGAHAAEDDEEPGKIEPAAVDLGRPVDFERDVVPILENNCLACHNVAIDEAGLDLEKLEGLLKGGDSGPAVVPGAPDESLIIQVASRSSEPFMPPLPNEVSATALTPRELGILRKWIEEGAKASATAPGAGVNFAALPDDLTAIYSVALAPHSQTVVMGRANQVYVVDIANGRTLSRLIDPELDALQVDGHAMYPGGAAHRDLVQAVAISPDGQMVASGGYRVVKLWKRSDQVERARLELGHEITAMAVSADGNLLAVGTPQNTIALWDLSSGSKVRELGGHTDRIHALTFWPTPADQHRVQQTLLTATRRVQQSEEELEAARAALSRFEARALADSEAEERKSLEDAVQKAEQALQAAVEAEAAAAAARTEFAERLTGSTRLFSASQDQSVRVWDPTSDTAGGTVPTAAAVTAILANADHIITGHADNAIRVWPRAALVDQASAPADAQEGRKEAETAEAETAAPQPEKELTGHSGPISELAFVPGAANQIVSGSADGTLRHWDYAAARQIRSMGHGGPVASVAARPDGQAVASAGPNQVVKLWELSSGKMLAEIKGAPSAQRTVVQLSDDFEVAKRHKSLADNAVQAAEKNLKDREEAEKKSKEELDAAAKALEEARKKAEEANKALEAAKVELEKKPDDNGLKKKVEDAQKAADSARTDVTKAEDADKAAQRTLDLSTKAVARAKERLDQSKSQQTQAEATQKSTEEQLNAAKKAESESTTPMTAVAFSPDGCCLATAGEDGRIDLWDAKAGQNVGSLPGHAAAVKALAFDAGTGLVSCAADHSVVVWETRPGWQLAAVLGPPQDNPMNVAQSVFVDRVLALDFSHDGTLLATGGGEPSRSGQLIVWDVVNRSIAHEFVDAHSDTIFGVEFSRDDQRLLTGAADKFVKIFDVKTGELVRSFEGHTHHVMDVSWQADGSVIASAGADNTIKVWDTETGEQKRTISNYAKQVTSIQFIGVGENVISSGGDQTVRLHRTSNGQNVRTFGGSPDYVYAAAANRDETVVVAGGEDGVLRVWDAKNGRTLLEFDPDSTP